MPSYARWSRQGKKTKPMFGTTVILIATLRSSSCRSTTKLVQTSSRSSRVVLFHLVCVLAFHWNLFSDFLVKVRGGFPLICFPLCASSMCALSAAAEPLKPHLSVGFGAPCLARIVLTSAAGSKWCQGPGPGATEPSGLGTRGGGAQEQAMGANRQASEWARWS